MFHRRWLGDENYDKLANQLHVFTLSSSFRIEFDHGIEWGDVVFVCSVCARWIRNFPLNNAQYKRNSKWFFYSIVRWWKEMLCRHLVVLIENEKKRMTMCVATMKRSKCRVYIAMQSKVKRCQYWFVIDVFCFLSHEQPILCVISFFFIEKQIPMPTLGPEQLHYMNVPSRHFVWLTINKQNEISLQKQNDEELNETFNWIRYFINGNIRAIINFFFSFSFH